MAGQPGDADFERHFIEWYVWASQHISFDPRRCRAAAWAAATGTGSQEELVAIAQRAASGPDFEELAAKPAPELAARAAEAAKAARPPAKPWLRTLGIIAAVIGVILLVLGGVCFALAQLHGGGGPPPGPPPPPPFSP